MIDSKMTPEEFVERWLPEYKEKREAHINSMSEVERFYTNDYMHDEFMVCAYFAEALEAFARHVWDQACREQRGECSDAWHVAIVVKGELYYESIAKAIQNAPAPEFKLTEKE